MIEWIIAVATVIIALSSVIYTIGTILLWRTTEKSIKLSEKAAEQAEQVFILNLLGALVNLHKPEYGMDKSKYDNYEKFIKDVESLLGKMLDKYKQSQ